MQAVLSDASRILESLHDVSGVHSFLLAVDPSDSADEGFLGGTVLGREFWRGLRGGGCMGATAFKLHCFKAAEAISSGQGDSSKQMAATSVKRTPATAIRTTLYANIRKALRCLRPSIVLELSCEYCLDESLYFFICRSVSGVRNAEMKWTNHKRLDAYNVRIVGWPQSVPTQNPSTLSTAENKLILESLENGTIKFVRTESAQSSEVEVLRKDPGSGSSTLPLGAEDDVDFSWAYNEGGPPSPAVCDSRRLFLP